MRDYHYIRKNDERITVAQMTDNEISEILRDDFEMRDPDFGETPYDIVERLKIELLARAIGA